MAPLASVDSAQTELINRIRHRLLSFFHSALTNRDSDESR